MQDLLLFNSLESVEIRAHKLKLNQEVMKEIAPIWLFGRKYSRSKYYILLGEGKKS